MGRAIRSYQPEWADDFEVAPHRYTYNDFDDTYRHTDDWTEFKKGIPYKVGDVIYVERHGVAKRAKIFAIFPRRTLLGDLQEVFRVQVETKSGRFSKLTEDVYPGYVQRGYKAAGLAPDLEGVK